jgi:hypothetical protein
MKIKNQDNSSFTGTSPEAGKVSKKNNHKNKAIQMEVLKRPNIFRHQCI